MKLTITIDLDNAVFDTKLTTEINRILADVGKNAKAAYRMAMRNGVANMALKDIDGNAVGIATMKGSS